LKKATVKRVSLGEDIRFGQQVEAGVIEVREQGAWKQVAAFGAVGHKRILALDTPVTTDQVRVRITQARGKVRLTGLSIY
jgi:alpha-L-fucosidase